MGTGSAFDGCLSLHVRSWRSRYLASRVEGGVRVVSRPRARAGDRPLHDGCDHRCDRRAFNKAVAKSSVQEPPADIGIDRFEFWLPKRRPDGLNLAMTFEPSIDQFGPANVIGGPFTMVVKGNNTLTIQDVLVGEVWIASGQSNMAMAVAASNNAKQKIADAKFPWIRTFLVPRVPAETPQQECGGKWVICSPETAGSFSAAAYFFGRELHQSLKTPVGLINSSYGGIWYQGESNSNPAVSKLYAEQLPLMIQDWRTRWGQGDFHFAWVQLPYYKPQMQEPNPPSDWACVRECMLRSLSVPNSGMAITIDTGDSNNIHPADKACGTSSGALGEGEGLWVENPILRSASGGTQDRCW